MADNSSICVSINGKDHPVLCGICEAPVSFVGATNGKTRDAGCTQCANVADILAVLAMAAEYTKDEEMLHLSQMAQGVPKTLNAMRVDGRTTHDQVYRFIVDLKA
ncbi:hypothetical protein [Leisingera sp. F5]|uniref:hypothetical protein n=1 Tax=Leisingera sp. F5 TaxID=1813816 RepID=UPI000AADC65D|nr:hypothetical protein [Leisingera sp. F5]